MKMRYALLIFPFLFLAACNSPEQKSAIEKDTLSQRDSVKRTISENLPPASDIKQFNWFYSAFTQAAITGNDSLFNVVIHPDHGLWIIHSDGAMPRFTNVKDILSFKLSNGKGLLPFNRNNMLMEPKEELLPKKDCDSKSFYDKTGCFTSTLNVFVEEKIWKSAGLTAEKDKEVERLAKTITRTVVNTSTYTFYFSLIDGSWYLTFIDIRKPCEA